MDRDHLDLVKYNKLVKHFHEEFGQKGSINVIVSMNRL